MQTDRRVCARICSHGSREPGHLTSPRRTATVHRASGELRPAFPIQFDPVGQNVPAVHLRRRHHIRVRLLVTIPAGAPGTTHNVGRLKISGTAVACTIATWTRFCPGGT